MKRLSLIVALAVFTAPLFGPTNRCRGMEPQQKSAEPAQRPKSDMEKLMAKKLTHAQKVLEAIALGEFDKIDNNATELLVLSKMAEFKVLKTPEYELHSNAFRRSLEEMKRGAKDRNLDGAALAYVDMTLTCVRCHKHVRGIRVTFKD
jgi:hypothetical protein